MCKTALVDKPFGCKNDQLYCGECYNQQFASRCDKCNQIFKPGNQRFSLRVTSSTSPSAFAGTKKLEYRGQQFHEHCFTCSSCSQPIGTKSFIPKDQKNFCVPCYQEHFATKCTRCLKVGLQPIARRMTRPSLSVQLGDRARGCHLQESALVRFQPSRG